MEKKQLKQNLVNIFQIWQEYHHQIHSHLKKVRNALHVIYIVIQLLILFLSVFMSIPPELISLLTFVDNSIKHLNQILCFSTGMQNILTYVNEELFCFGEDAVMRKGQITILENANKCKMKQETIDLLSREDLTLDELRHVYRYICKYRKSQDERQLVAEAERSLKITYGIKDRKEKEAVLCTMLRVYTYDTTEDTLLGNKAKWKFKKVVHFFLQYPQEIRYHMLWTYVDAMYRKLPVWHIGELLRYTKDNSTNFDYLFFKNPELLDDYICNKESSLVWWMMQNCKKIPYHCPKLLLCNLYHWDSHSFGFPVSECSSYINIENGSCYTKAVLELIEQKNPIVKYVHSFAKEHMKAYRNGNSTRYEAYYMTDDVLKERCKQAYNLIRTTFTVKTDAYSFFITVQDNLFINIKFSQYKMVRFDEHGWHFGETARYKSEFTILPDGRLMKQKGKHLIPFSMKDFYFWYQEPGLVGSFMQQLSDVLAKQNPFFKDILTDICQCGAVLSATVDEVMHHYNRTDYIRSHYKQAKELAVNWNKQNIGLSSLIIRSLPYVDGEKCRNILLQQKNPGLITRYIASARRTEKIYAFLEEVIKQNLMAALSRKQSCEKSSIRMQYETELDRNVMTGLLEDEREQFLTEKENAESGWENIILTIRDYVNACRQTKAKIRIDIYSIEQLNNLHELRTMKNVDHRKATGEVKVPKNSKFAPLREILPQEFEWITTRIRLILETELQHHCVWSYASAITNDQSAIYSFVDTEASHSSDGRPKRYTIEFKMDRHGMYYVEQVQGKYDSVNANGMKEYIQSLLDTMQTDATSA